MKLAGLLLFVVVVVVTTTTTTVSGQEEFCNMCGGGDDAGTPMNSDLIVPFLAIGDNTNPSCKQVFDFANESVKPADDVCSLIKSHKDFCGCPGASTRPLGKCSLCPGGATPMNLNAVTPFSDTCSELDTYLRYLPEDLCETERVGSILSADAFCGCPGVKAECYMCDDDTNDLSNPDRKVPFYEFLGNSFSSTCQELADFYTLYDTGDPNLGTCKFVQMESGYCGCNSEPNGEPVGACSFCSDGSSPANTNKLVDELGMTCGELETYLDFVPADQCDMPWIIDYKRFDYYCGCESATAPCPMCPDGTIEISNPDSVIPYLIIPNDENPTCRDLATLGVIAEPGELVMEDCSIFEAQAGFCGCVGASKPETSCEFCPGGEDPPNAELVTPFGDTCRELSDYLGYQASDQCDSERIGFVKRQDFLCGCTAATTSCALCADDGSNDAGYADRNIPLLSLPLNTNPTCGEVVEFMAVNDGDLSDAGCSALQEYQGYCGCPDYPAKNECSFCPNGGTPSEPDKIVSDVFTCGGLYDFVSFLRGDECTSDSTDFEEIAAFAYVCGCPDTYPSCTLCPDGDDPSSPDKLIGDSDGTTCGEFAESIATWTESQCADRADDVVDAAQMCGCKGAAPVATDPGSGGGGKCPIQQNPDMCTIQLLNSAPNECDCYAFCDSEFVKCQSSQGGLLSFDECGGTPVTGCNRAGLASFTARDDDDFRASEKASEKFGNKQKSGPNPIIVSAIVVPILLAFLVLVYYLLTRGGTLKEDANKDFFADSDPFVSPAGDDLRRPPMEGSLSMADVPAQSSPAGASSPPPESFSIDEDDHPASPVAADPGKTIV